MKRGSERGESGCFLEQVQDDDANDSLIHHQCFPGLKRCVLRGSVNGSTRGSRPCVEMFLNTLKTLNRLSTTKHQGKEHLHSHMQLLLQMST